MRRISAASRSASVVPGSGWTTSCADAGTRRGKCQRRSATMSVAASRRVFMRSGVIAIRARKRKRGRGVARRLASPEPRRDERRSRCRLRRANGVGDGLLVVLAVQEARNVERILVALDVLARGAARSVGHALEQRAAHLHAAEPARPPQARASRAAAQASGGGRRLRRRRGRAGRSNVAAGSGAAGWGWSRHRLGAEHELVVERGVFRQLIAPARA